MANVAVGGLGMAVAVLGPLLLVMTGLRGGDREYVEGTGHVNEVSPLPTSDEFGRCDLKLVVNAPGVRNIPVRVREASVPVSKWPEVGDNLPIKIDISDHRRVQILWDRVRTYREIEFDDLTNPSDLDDLTDLDESLDPDDDLIPYPDYREPDYGERDYRERDYSADRDMADQGSDYQEDQGMEWPGPDETEPPPVLAPLPRPAPRPSFTKPEQPDPLAHDDGTYPGPETTEPQTTEPEATPPAAPPPESPQRPQEGISQVSVTLIVSDLSRSREFYRDILGLEEIDATDASAVLAVGGARVILRQVSDMPPIDRRVVHLNLDVPDVQEAYQRLKEKGVEFVHRPRSVAQGEHLELCSATFRDPDGHAIGITRWAVRP